MQGSALRYAILYPQTYIKIVSNILSYSIRQMFPPMSMLILLLQTAHFQSRMSTKLTNMYSSLQGMYVKKLVDSLTLNNLKVTL